MKRMSEKDSDLVSGVIKSATNEFTFLYISLLILDGVYIVDQGGKGSRVRENECDQCFQMFYFFFLILGVRE